MPFPPQKLRAPLAVVVAALSVLVADVAQAASCGAMKGEARRLASPDRAEKRYGHAMKRQRAQIVRVRALMRTHGCGGIASRACTTLQRSRGEMHRNLASLSREAKNAARRRQGRRSRLQRRISKRCAKPNKRTAARPAAVKKPSSIRRTRSVRSQSVVALGIDPRRNGPLFSTMCVRLCDGYAFPVSLSTTRDRFDRDANACDALCPGAVTRLFAAPVWEGTLDASRDVRTGRPYPELATAYRHRERFDRACQCRKARRKPIDYGRPIRERRQRAEPKSKPAARVRVVGPDYFGGS